MSRRVCWPMAFAGCVLAVVALASWADPEPSTAALREAVLRADSADKAAPAYKAYFLRHGRAGLKPLSKDADIGIALQAAWETHLKPAKRKEKDDHRSDDVYDPVEVGAFVTFLKERTKAPVPDWWAKGITDVDLFPDQHHAFIGPWEATRKKLKDARTDPKELRVEEKGDNLVCRAGGRVVEFPKHTFDLPFTDSFFGWLGVKRAVVAGYTGLSGLPYQVAGFEGKGGKPAWKADVWGAGRTELGGLGYHRVEMTEKGGVVYLFGMESHGAYFEGFDVASGKVRFRFCTCYWFHHSEEWALK